MSLMRETNEERSDGTNEMLGELKISVSQSSLQQQPELFQGIILRAEALSKVVPEDSLTRIYPIDVSTIIKYGISTSRRFLLTFTWHDSRNPNDQD